MSFLHRRRHHQRSQYPPVSQLSTTSSCIIGYGTYKSDDDDGDNNNDDNNDDSVMMDVHAHTHAHANAASTVSNYSKRKRQRNNEDQLSCASSSSSSDSETVVYNDDDDDGDMNHDGDDEEEEEEDVVVANNKKFSNNHNNNNNHHDNPDYSDDERIILRGRRNLNALARARARARGQKPEQQLSNTLTTSQSPDSSGTPSGTKSKSKPMNDFLALQRLLEGGRDDDDDDDNIDDNDDHSESSQSYSGSDNNDRHDHEGGHRHRDELLQDRNDLDDDSDNHNDNHDDGNNDQGITNNHGQDQVLGCTSNFHDVMDHDYDHDRHDESKGGGAAQQEEVEENVEERHQPQHHHQPNNMKKNSKNKYTYENDAVMMEDATTSLPMSMSISNKRNSSYNLSPSITEDLHLHSKQRTKPHPGEVMENSCTTSKKHEYELGHDYKNEYHNEPSPHSEEDFNSNPSTDTSLFPNTGIHGDTTSTSLTSTRASTIAPTMIGNSNSKKHYGNDDRSIHCTTSVSTSASMQEIIRRQQRQMDRARIKLQKQQEEQSQLYWDNNDCDNDDDLFGAINTRTMIMSQINSKRKRSQGMNFEDIIAPSQNVNTKDEFASRLFQTTTTRNQKQARIMNENAMMTRQVLPKNKKNDDGNTSNRRVRIGTSSTNTTSLSSVSATATRRTSRTASASSSIISKRKAQFRNRVQELASATTQTSCLLRKGKRPNRHHGLFLQQHAKSSMDLGIDSGSSLGLLEEVESSSSLAWPKWDKRAKKDVEDSFGPSFLSNRKRKNPSAVLENVIEVDDDDDGVIATRTRATSTSTASRTAATPILIQSSKMHLQRDTVFATPRTVHHSAEDETLDPSSTTPKTRSNTSSLSSGRRRGKKNHGPLSRLLQSIRGSIEADCLRFQSGTFPFRSDPNGRSMNDPRNRAFNFIDVTIVGRTGLRTDDAFDPHQNQRTTTTTTLCSTTKPTCDFADAEKIVVLGYIHSFAYNIKATPKKFGRYRKSIYSNVSSRIGQNSIEGNNEQEDPPLSCPTFAWLCFTQNTCLEQGISNGVQLRVYNVNVLSTPTSESKTGYFKHIVLCTWLCERHPKELPPLPPVPDGNELHQD